MKSISLAVTGSFVASLLFGCGGAAPGLARPSGIPSAAASSSQQTMAILEGSGILCGRGAPGSYMCPPGARTEDIYEFSVPRSGTLRLDVQFNADYNELFFIELSSSGNVLIDAVTNGHPLYNPAAVPNGTRNYGQFDSFVAKVGSGSYELKVHTSNHKTEPGYQFLLTLE